MPLGLVTVKGPVVVLRRSRFAYGSVVFGKEASDGSPTDEGSDFPGISQKSKDHCLYNIYSLVYIISMIDAIPLIHR